MNNLKNQIPSIGKLHTYSWSFGLVFFLFLGLSASAQKPPRLNTFGAEVARVINVTQKALDQKKDRIIIDELLNGKYFVKAIGLGGGASNVLNYIVPILNEVDSVRGYVDMEIEQGKIVHRDAYDFNGGILPNQKPVFNIILDSFTKIGYKVPKKLLYLSLQQAEEKKLYEEAHTRRMIDSLLRLSQHP